MPITVGNLGRLGAVSQRGRDIVFSFESSDLVLTPLLPNLIRHTWVPTHWRLNTEKVAERTRLIAATGQQDPPSPLLRLPTSCASTPENY
jgi:hypothetical protein